VPVPGGNETQLELPNAEDGSYSRMASTLPIRLLTMPLPNGSITGAA
jgi:hypothetical protein